MRSFVPSAIAVLFLCVALVGCAEDELAASDAALSTGAVAANDRNDQDAGAEPADAAKRDTSPARPTPAQGAPDSGTPAANDAGAAPARRADASPAPSTMTPVQGEIETVMMYVVYTLGIGGGVYPNPRPIILFKDGSATTDINFVVRGLDVPTHKAMFPNTWTEWKTIDGKVARRSGMNWTTLEFQLKYAPNASTLTLDEAYTHLNGATIGETTAFTQQSVRFFADHKVIWGSSGGVTSPSTTVASLPPDQRGTYQIDGYTIEFKWDDGKVTRSSFVWSDKDPSAVFIAGAGYVLLD